MKKIFIGILLIISLGCHSVEPKKEVIIFHAGSLSAPMKRMEEEFENRFPDIDILREAAGSKGCARMIRDLKKPCDIMISSDYRLIDELLIPGYADWNILFASNEMVLAYTDKSRFADRISKDNWFDILSRREVVWGYSDPDLDPCGYRTLLVLELAEDHYQRPGLYRRLIDNCPKRNIRPKEVELISLLQTGNMDYAWEYRSVAVQHGLRFIELPEEINLSNPEDDRSITYGLTLIKGAPNTGSAVLFLRFFLSPEGGLKILKEMGQPPCIPPMVKPGYMLARLPEELKPLVTAAE